MLLGGDEAAYNLDVGEPIFFTWLEAGLFSVDREPTTAMGGKFKGDQRGKS